MAFKRPVRNMDGIMYESLRKKVDAIYNDLHDDLSEAYYDFWKKGLSKPFFAWDVRNTPENTKLQFDILQGVLWNVYVILFHKVNQVDPAGGIPEDQYRYVRDEEGTIILDKVQAARDWLQTNSAQYGIPLGGIKNRVESWVKNQLGHTVAID